MTFIAEGLYGYIGRSNLPKVLETLNVPGVDLDPNDDLLPGRETVIATTPRNATLARQDLASSPGSGQREEYFCLPPDRVVELGSQVEI